MLRAADAFGEYWAAVFAPRIYQPFYANAKNGGEMLLKMDNVHIRMPKTRAEAKPPRFE